MGKFRNFSWHLIRKQVKEILFSLFFNFLIFLMKRDSTFVEQIVIYMPKEYNGMQVDLFWRCLQSSDL